LNADQTTDRPAGRLTDREREILALVANGGTYRDIAAALDISIYTVKTHLQGVFRRLHVHTRTHAVVEALRSGDLHLDGITRPQMEANTWLLTTMVGRAVRLTLADGSVVAAQVVAVDRRGVDVLVLAIAQPKRRYAHRDILGVERLDASSGA
jgi:DNA-binding CsgD family transcriptional regulator